MASFFLTSIGKDQNGKETLRTTLKNDPMSGDKEKRKSDKVLLAYEEAIGRDWHILR